MKFRESFRGYNKEDVNSYIEQMNIKFSRRESELLAMIQTENSNDDETDALTSSLSAENEALGKKIEELEEMLSSAENERTLLSARIAELESKENDVSENAVTGERLGNILLIANENAEKIVQDAKAEASRIISEANLKASSIEYEVSLEKKRATEEFGKNIALISREYLSDCTEIIAEASVKINATAEKLTEKANKLCEI